MSNGRGRAWPTKERDLRLSRIDAQQIRRRRQARKRRERRFRLVWAVGLLLWVLLTMWIALGR